MDEISFSENGETIIPEGYKWCENCEALTPHRPGDFQHSTYCEVCDCFKTGMVECPVCGCEEKEDQASSNIVIKHHPGCHRRNTDENGEWRLYSHAENVLIHFKRDFMRPAPNRSSYGLPKDREWYDKNMRLKKILSNHDKKFECGCPRFTIYTCINQVVLDGAHGSTPNGDWGWFRYKVRCPVCGHVYDADADY